MCSLICDSCVAFILVVLLPRKCWGLRHLHRIRAFSNEAYPDWRIGTFGRWLPCRRALGPLRIATSAPAKRALTEATMRLTTEPMPDAVYDEAARHFSAGEWTHRIWRMA